MSDTKLNFNPVVVSNLVPYLTNTHTDVRGRMFYIPFNAKWLDKKTPALRIYNKEQKSKL
jgi:hypothetical protein